MNKTYDKAVIILIPVDFEDSNKIATRFMGTEHDSLAEAAKAVTDALQENEKVEDDEVLVYRVEDFCAACNRQEFESLSEYFTTTVYVS